MRLLAIALFTTALAFSTDASADAWSKTGDSDGIKVYRRDSGNGLIAFKGEGLISAPLVRVASVVFDTARATEWIDSLSEAKVLRRMSDMEYVEYDHFSMPFPLTDRDFVTSNRMEYDAAKRTITIRIRSVSDPAAPSTSNVRGTLISSTFVLTPTPDGSGTYVIGDVDCDPRGSVPNWIVNFFQKDWPHDTLMALRKQVAKPNIVENAAIRKLVTPAAQPAP
jgi:hypothetical protein